MSDLETLLEKYQNYATELANLVADLTDEQLDAVPVPDTWSIRQLVCHIADFEIVAADRIKRVLAEDNPHFFDGDPTLFADRLGYAHRCIDNEIQQILSIRRSVATILTNCDVEDFQRTGVHSVDGPMTLETLLERAAGHIPHHIVFLKEKLAAITS